MAHEAFNHAVEVRIMQIDMHYYGTYAMARAAGLKPDVAQTIATASQFVDEFEGVQAELRDGTYLSGESTAYDPMYLENVASAVQRKVWVPFHFLPGNEGKTYEQRMICRMDSALSRLVVDHALQHARRDYGPAMIGVAAHVYADTFSHYGFSGIASDMNEVQVESIEPKIRNADLLTYVTSHAGRYFEKGITNASNALKLGHGGAATFPDKPYLKWAFRYVDGRATGERDNLATFMQACQRLYELFQRFGEMVPHFADRNAARPYAEIEMVVGSILAEEGVVEDRIEKWQRAARDGQLYVMPSQIPRYPQWGLQDRYEGLQRHSSQSIASDPLYQFMQAADIHRRYVLQELLPAGGLKVVLP